MRHELPLKPSGINLLQLLKLFSIAETGGHAKEIIADGCVTVNNETEFRLRRKLHEGDVVRFEDIEIKLISKE